ncbi:MAG TPA: hypothetical protein VFI32_07395 [Rhodanobacteraceae bacterium]|nr:hypothetical protein [Rhodanobacteraceae bacterium]
MAEKLDNSHRPWRSPLRAIGFANVRFGIPPAQSGLHRNDVVFVRGIFITSSIAAPA